MKNMEIERKYLLDGLPFDMSKFECSRLRQGYISTNPTIRLRSSQKINQAYKDFHTTHILTVKGSGALTHEEYELEITEQQFEKLWLKVETFPVDKIRYLVPLPDGHTAELDEYKGRLDGLFTVEVEFESLEDESNFVAPSWFGTDVTYEQRYKNGNLARISSISELK